MNTKWFKKKELCALCDNESRKGLLLCNACAKKYELKANILTVDVKTSDFEEVKELLKALKFYATTPRSGLHEDGGNLARKTLEKFANLK